MSLALLPFFQFFRDTPHQQAAIKELEDSIPKDLLADDAAWFEAWKASGISQRAFVPYFHQLDDPDGDGHRQCLTAAAAMIAATYGKVDFYDEYKQVRERFGDTTSIHAHVKALRSLGLEVEFRMDADRYMVEHEIASGRPVLVGWIHRGPIDRPHCGSATCGHWSVITGYEGIYSPDSFWIMHDPYGIPNLELGEHETRALGKNIRIPRAAFDQRWQLEGKMTGWAILVSDV